MTNFEYHPDRYTMIHQSSIVLPQIHIPGAPDACEGSLLPGSSRPMPVLAGKREEMQETHGILKELMVSDGELMVISWNFIGFDDLMIWWRLYWDLIGILWILNKFASWGIKSRSQILGVKMGDSQTNVGRKKMSFRLVEPLKLMKFLDPDPDMSNPLRTLLKFTNAWRTWLWFFLPTIGWLKHHLPQKPSLLVSLVLLPKADGSWSLGAESSGDTVGTSGVSASKHM